MATKKQLQAERLLLEAYIKNNPQVKTLLDSLLAKDGVEMSDIIQPIIKEKLEEARMIGVNIGWEAAFLRCEEAIHYMNNVEEIKAYVNGEAKKIREKLGIKEDEQNM